VPRLRQRVAKDATVANRIPLANEARLAAGPQARGNELDPNAVKIQPQTEADLTAEGMSNGGFWSPGRPLQPLWQEGSEPRQWDFNTGYNIASRPRSTATKVSFDTLRQMTDSYEVARICIEHVEDDIRSLDWRIVPVDGVKDDVQDQVDAAMKFWKKPDGTTPFDSWQSSFMEDVLRYDAGALYKGRLKSGKIAALEIIDGTTLAPLLDYQGRRPQGNAPAFIQWLHGAPAKWIRADDIIYQPFRMQSSGPYGLPPMEWLLLTANTDIRFQWHFLNYFTEGSMPGVFMEAPPDQSNPDQVNEFQAIWNQTMEGDQAVKWKVKWIPSGAKPYPMRDEKFDPKFPEYLAWRTCAAYKVTPNDIGITTDVNRATGETQVDVQSRIGSKPRRKYLAGIYTSFMQESLGLTQVQFEYDSGEEKEDRYQEAQVHDLYVRMGAEGVDEVRENVLGLPIDPAAPVPRFIMTRTGATPLKDVIRLAGEKIDPETAAPEPGSITPEPDDQPELQGLETQAAVTAVDVPGKLPAQSTIAQDAQAAGAVVPPAAPAPKSDVGKELRQFQKFAKARAASGEWRDFEFTALDPATALALNATGRRDPERARGLAGTLARRTDEG
jgi:hypothetical protein